ncbi:hypothetical protein BCR34DRAFT_610496 [Clohesyomyces aquaticus]|uniref:Uncharacterized protein n=1 Tax=Clohesyomyces aquaticus TaxID=1231657 RepID=A0A1Y2A6V1_9PLEO|nr:hypothetical protein BCR34DRAFT_610496 [Clohesyomyces aquaticus]
MKFSTPILLAATSLLTPATVTAKLWLMAATYEIGPAADCSSRDFKVTATAGNVCNEWGGDCLYLRSVDKHCTVMSYEQNDCTGHTVNITTPLQWLDISDQGSFFVWCNKHNKAKGLP